MASNQNETWLSLGRCSDKPPSHNIRVLQVCLRLFLTQANPQKLETCLKLCLTRANPQKLETADSRKKRASLMKRLKQEKGEGSWCWSYAPRLECVSALCMFCTFCRFCRFLHRRPTVRLAHVLVYLALVLVDLCTSITVRQKKKPFHPFLQPGCFSFLILFLSPCQCFG